MLDKVVTPAGVSTKVELQVGRLILAQQAVSKAIAAREDLEKENTTSDLDQMLDPKSLRDLAKNFWSRYHMLYDPEDDISDRLISRLSKEMTNKNLELKDVFTIKSLAAQQKITKAKTQLAPNLVFEETDDQYKGARNPMTYIHHLALYMRALAKAGCFPIPTAVDPETFATQDAVAVPLDVTSRYVARATKSAELVTYNERLEW